MCIMPVITLASFEKVLILSIILKTPENETLAELSTPFIYSPIKGYG